MRLEFAGQVAQVDHLVINRLMQVWVCESKSYNSGASVNQGGEWTTRVNGRTVGLPSPIEQNRRHLVVLQRLFDADVCAPPRRLGQRIMPYLRSTIEAQFDERLRGLLRVITQAELERFAGDLAALHRPLPLDVEAHYGLGRVPAVTTPRLRDEQPGSAPSCRRCGRPLTKQEAWFCRFNKARFSGGFYCIDCQAAAGSAAWARETHRRTQVQR